MIMIMKSSLVFVLVALVFVLLISENSLANAFYFNDGSLSSSSFNYRSPLSFTKSYRCRMYGICSRPYYSSNNDDNDYYRPYQAPSSSSYQQAPTPYQPQQSSSYQQVPPPSYQVISSYQGYRPQQETNDYNNNNNYQKQSYSSY